MGSFGFCGQHFFMFFCHITLNFLYVISYCYLFPNKLILDKQKVYYLKNRSERNHKCTTCHHFFNASHMWSNSIFPLDILMWENTSIPIYIPRPPPTNHSNPPLSPYRVNARIFSISPYIAYIYQSDFTGRTPGYM